MDSASVINKSHWQLNEEKQKIQFSGGKTPVLDQLSNFPMFKILQIHFIIHTYFYMYMYTIISLQCMSLFYLVSLHPLPGHPQSGSHC